MEIQDKWYDEFTDEEIAKIEKAIQFEDDLEKYGNLSSANLDILDRFPGMREKDFGANITVSLAPNRRRDLSGK